VTSIGQEQEEQWRVISGKVANRKRSSAECRVASGEPEEKQWRVASDLAPASSVFSQFGNLQGPLTRPGELWATLSPKGGRGPEI
jgi:hypothetical protein